VNRGRTKPLAVVIGFIGKLPVAGMSLYNLHYIAGLQALGYDIHYVERQNEPCECYDPGAGDFTDDPRYALGYLETVLAQFGITGGQFSFLDREGGCHGSGWDTLRGALDRADFVFALADPTWFDELERCPRRAFIDGDPMFTQILMAEGELCRARVPFRYNVLFTYAVRMGMADCLVPTAGREWIGTRPVVATRLWDPTPAVGPLPITTVMHWGAWEDMIYQGRIYGHKNRELERFIDLPRRTAQSFVLAVAGSAPDGQLREHGWHLVDPVAATITIESYRKFIAGSRADFGIAKHAYVASRSGWFSDRSTCYLAAGRPVLHQDTGCGDWLPTGEGVLLFSDVDDVLEALRKLDADYERHAQAARAIAEEHFEATEVIGRMLDDAGFR
jgi:hypothetical protein